MYFLNGYHLYIEPENCNATVHEQLLNCMEQTLHINGGKKLFKLNFFLDTPSDEAYRHFLEKIGHLIDDGYKTPVIYSIISQPPVTGSLVIEAFYYDTSLWNPVFINEGCGMAVLFKRGNTEVFTGSIQANSHNLCRDNALEALNCLGEMLGKVNLPVNSIVRQWNYIENILGPDDGHQRYQEYNNIRSAFYSDHFTRTGYPAATGIGMHRGGVITEFIAVSPHKALSMPLDNPNQVAAHSYSREVLAGNISSDKYTPKFERARYMEIFGRKLIFISGTASIRGETTVGAGDPEEQTRITTENIRSLYSPEILQKISENRLNPVYGHARVYLKDRSDYSAIRKIFRKSFGKLPVVYLIADICRQDLLVEIEGEVILE
ncbi:MAG: hypothetical protein PHH93_05185 [Prolixibacteraceae bacterium]|nr:hypothetical protein [Prolixibacteraceae bacterium]